MHSTLKCNAKLKLYLHVLTS